MAVQSRDKLKQYFQPGDVPTQTEYGHLIDSPLNLADPNLQIMSGTLSASNFFYNNLFVYLKEKYDVVCILLISYFDNFYLLQNLQYDPLI